MEIKKIYIGSWFQRTTLHLSEIYDFLTEAESPLDLDKNTLRELRNDLNILTVEDIHEDFEYIAVTAKGGIAFKIYEDGLIVLSHETKEEEDVKGSIEALTTYYEKSLSAGISYIFSLGAPIPKELANIKTVYPYFIVLDRASASEIESLLGEFKQIKHFEIKKDTFEVYRGNTLYIVNSLGESFETIEQFIGEQVFIREFKAQMHRYLNLHRVIWENIAEVKERGSIKGSDIGEFKEKIERYQKSISMIGTRINQMGVYIGTRGSIIKNNPEMEKFVDVLQFKYETLNNTLSYVKEIWGMTRSYVESALDVFGDLQSKATSNSIKNLTVVTSMGVGATLLGLFSQTKLPTFTLNGIYYFAILAFIGWAVNKIMNKIYLSKEYSIKDVKVDTNIT